jgi:hypothetical protein
MKISLPRHFIIHPVLFASFPALSLCAHNAKEMSVTEVILPLLVINCCALLIWLMSSYFLRDTERSALITSFTVSLFFSYGPISDLLRSIHFLGVSFARERYLFFAWVLLMAFGIYGIISLRNSKHTYTRIINITGIILVAYPLMIITPKLFSNNNHQVNVAALSEKGVVNKDLPDIYYFILDSYGRSDVLSEIYQLDNSPFLKFLKDKGFYIAERSHANYPHTFLSLASSLNFQYLDDLATKIGPQSNDLSPLSRMTKKNRVCRLLKEFGYEIVTSSRQIDADIYFTPQWTLSEFDNLLINATPITAILYQLRSPLSSFQCELHRRAVLYFFDKMPSVAQMPKERGPFFVFAYVLVPHPPFVFGERGEPLNPNRPFSFEEGRDHSNTSSDMVDEYRYAYKQQTSFVNKKMEHVLGEILAGSRRPIVIIIQGDHGPGSTWWPNDIDRTNIKERMSILNAYYFSDRRNNGLYMSITPVNSFRYIFNQYSEKKMELLPDKSYFAKITLPYDYTDVTERLENAL